MQYILMILALVLNLPTVYLGVMFLFTFRKRRAYPRTKPATRFAVIIPARNEEKVIGNLIRRLRAQDYPQDLIDIYTVVNNCTDNTEAAALDAGAKIIRCTGSVTCKGDVLHQAFDQLLPMDYDAFAIFDADNLPDPAFMQVMNDALAAGERVCKGRLKSGNAFQSWVSGSYGLYHALMEWSYSRPHSAAGFSSNLVGTAFVIHREVMDALGGWNTVSICEDTEFAALSTRLGYRVAWVPEALSYDEQVTSFRVSLRQRYRWCSGMIQSARLLGRSMFSASCARPGMARDFGMLFLISHTAPLALLPMLFSLPFQPVWMLLLTAASLLLSCAAMILLAVILCLLGGYPIRRMWLSILLFPIFMLSWFPLQLLSVFRPIRTWEQIHHSGQPHLGDSVP